MAHRHTRHACLAWFHAFCLQFPGASLAAMVERLDEKPVYYSVAQVGGSAESCAFAGLKPTGLDLSFPDGLVLHYDLEGRLTRAATPNVQWRRGLSHRTVRLRKRSRDEGGGLETRMLDPSASDRVVDEMSRRVSQITESFPRDARLVRFRGERLQAAQEMEVLVARAAAFDAPAAHADLERFRRIYGDIPILPPDQYGALVLLATEGCIYNQCTFCGFYRGVRYRMKSVEQFAEHVRAAVAYHGAALAGRRSIFLGQANALTGPGRWREEILEAVGDTFQFAGSEAHDVRRAIPSWWAGFPLRMAGMASFIDAFSGSRIGTDEFVRLREHHLRQLYFGIETGDERLLGWLQKPATPSQMIGAVTAAKHAGLQVALIVLVGAGGEKYFESHVAETARLVQAMPLGRGDSIYLSPLVAMPETEYFERARADGVMPLSPARLAAQEQQLRAALQTGPRGNRPYLARYDVSHFVY